jgi:carbon storage regulator CsrA
MARCPSRRAEMLVLSRKLGEKVLISNGITVTVLAMEGNRVRIGIDAPDRVRILRGKLACWQNDPVVSEGQLGVGLDARD